VQTRHVPAAGGARGRVELELADAGPGVPAGARARIFEPFFTTKAGGEGTGLGLAVSYGIVAAPGGTLELVRTGPDGTTFRVSLPTADGGAAALSLGGDESALAAPPARRSPLAGLRLLFVDDEAAIRTEAEAFARARGFTVLGAADGLEALSLVRATGVDAVVCDVRMPRMDGAEFHAVLHREQPGLASRTVFTAGDADTAPPHHPVVPKPFRFEDIERAVLGVLR
jgi:CheY-like chemotaxis protein